MDWDLSRKIVLKRTNSTKKWPNKVQADFLTHLGELLQNGVTLKDALMMMQFLLPAHKGAIQEMLTQLATGSRFDEVLVYGGFSDSVRSQIFLSLQNSSMSETSIVLGEYLRQKHQQLQKLRQVLLYPCLLMALLLLMVVVMRYLLLDQLRELISIDVLQQKWFLFLIWQGFVYLPQLLVVFSVCSVMVVLLLRYYWQQQNALKRIYLLEHCPLIGSLVRQYYTFLYAREFAYFLGQSHSVLQLIQQMQQQGTTRLTQAIALELNTRLLEGEAFEEALQGLQLFEETLCLLMIEGAFTTRLDVKLRQFSKYTFQQFQASIERKITWIQPILFLAIGCVIVAVYAILLLPTVTMIGGI